MTPPAPTIRMVDLAQRHLAVADDVEARVLDVLRSGRYIGGPVVAEAEQAIARSFGLRHGVGVSSGTDGLVLALEAVGVAPGDEVILPALSFFATAGAVCSVGAVPVVVDVRDDACIDPDAARAALGPRTRAVLPVHLFGTLAHAPALGVPVIDDAAQAVGGHPPRSTGVLTVLSAYPTKSLAAAGDAGLVLGDDEELIARVRALGNHGQTGPHHHEPIAGRVGRNSRLDAVQAAVLLGHLPGLDARIARRRAHAARYDAAFAGRIDRVPRDAGSPVHQYVIRHPARDRLAADLAARGIETAIYYPRPLHAQPALAGRCRALPTPVADALTREVLAIPVHAGLDDDDVDAVARAVLEAAG